MKKINLLLYQFYLNMKHSRAKSASSVRSVSSQSRPRMEKKLKQRTGNHSIIDDHSKSVYISECSQKESSKKQTRTKGRSKSMFIDPQNIQNEEEFIKLKQISDMCTCGRHLCKVHTAKPDMTKQSIHQRDFQQKFPVPNLVNHAKEYDPLKGPHLGMNSSYLKDYDKPNGDPLSRPKPEDLLKKGGPDLKLSTYRAEFPGHHGDNQYIKPTDKHTRGKFPLRGRSTYSNHFQGKPRKQEDWERVQDNLKSGRGWFGDTTYSKNFQFPESKNYPSHVKVKEKLQINPDYDQQYQTTYRNEFFKKQKAVCPAKQYLESRAKGIFKDSKGSFAQNTDFKSFNPDFQAISTSKHSFV